MPEEKQMLQTLCERAAAKLSENVRHLCPVTLLAFYRNVGALGNAFASSLPNREAIVQTIEATVSRSCGAQVADPDPDVFLPSDEELPWLGEHCRDLMPLSCGFVLIFGSGSNSSCTTYEDLNRMRDFLTHIALPQFKDLPASPSLKPERAS
jgi:hypothetical protein